MTDSEAVPVARRAAEQLRSELPAPWEIFGEELLRHEIHYVGDRVEIVRGPIELEGIGLRIFRPREGQMGVGSGSTNDLSRDGLRRALRDAELGAKLSVFPAERVVLPGGTGPTPTVSNTDRRIVEDPLGALRAFAAQLLGQFPDGGRREVGPSFGSLRVTFGRRSVVNSAGVERSDTGTLADLEWAVKSTAGPEGAPAGEYWVNSRARRLDPDDLEVDVPRWIRVARDVRSAGAPTGGTLPVIFPPSILSDIVPEVLGGRLSGAAERRQMASPVGTQVASELLTIDDDPHLPWATHTGGFDDEGSPTRSSNLLERGVVRAHVYDVLNGAALGQAPTGDTFRTARLGESWFRFTEPPAAQPLNFDVRPGSGGTDEELLEAVGEGLWLEQLGHTFPDAATGGFGGEIRIAYRIHGGRLAEPVRGGTIGGLVLAPSGTPSLMGNVTAIGSRPRLIGRFRSPAWLVAKTPVSGGS